MRSAYLLSAGVSCQSSVAVHHHFVPCVDIVANGLTCRMSEDETWASHEERHTLPWFWAILDVFKSVPAAANMVVSRPKDENQRYSD